MTGLYTFSWKFPCEPAKATAWSFPNTCTATMVSASHCVGLILPGMIDEPGSFSGIRSSAKPARGPQAYHRTSLAIFMSAPASVRSVALTFTIASCADSAANRSEEHTSELQSRLHLVCRLLLEKKKKTN